MVGGKVEYVKVIIPKSLYDRYKRLSDKVRELGFNSIDDFVSYLLRNALSELEEEEVENAFSEEEEEKIKERLRALGYID